MEFDKQKFLSWAKEHYNYDALKAEGISAFTGWSIYDGTVFFGKMKEVLDFLKKVVEVIEHFHNDMLSLSSKEKLDAAVEFIDDLIKMPRLAEWADQIVIKSLLSSIVLQYNDFFGKNWVNKVHEQS